MTGKAIVHIKSAIDPPATWHSAYTDTDRAGVLEIVTWLNDGQVHEPGYANTRTQKKLARAAKIDHSTLNTVLRGRYVSPPGKFIAKALDVIRRWDLREDEGVSDTPFVETSVYRLAAAACHRAHLYRNFAVVSACVGTGKTRAVKHYAAHNANVILIEATPDMNAGVLLGELVPLTGAVVHKANKHSGGTKSERMAAVIRALKGTDSLLILDEAETVSTQTLEYVRRISDKAGIGVVLSGTEKLQPLLRDPLGRFGQISSRVGFWPPVVRAITEEDAHAIARAALSDQALDDEVLDAFWQMCDGSARVLAASLIPGVTDYGLKKGKPLTSELVLKVGQDVLGFKTKRKQP